MRLIRAGLLALALTAGSPAVAADPAVETVGQVYARFESAVKAGPGTLKDRIDAIGPTLENTFDFPAMIRLAVGGRWADFTPEQQGAVTEAFRRNFVTTYANRLAQAAGGTFTVLPDVEASGANRIVQTRVTTPDGDESEVAFVVNGSNLVQDVLLNGNVSEVAAQRASLAEPLSNGGADGLLVFLRQRTEGMLAAKRTP